MSKQSELYALRHSFSGDSPVTVHNRSGDSEGDGAERWNFIASVQSAEADIIDEEECAERQEAKRKFAKFLGLYFKKILTPIEYEFLKEYLKGELTPHKVGLKLGIKHQEIINYKQTIKSIIAKHKSNEQKILLLMQYSGYDFRHGLEIFPQLEKYMQRRSLTLEQRAKRRERDKQRYRRLVESDRESYNEQRRLYFQKYKEENRYKINARQKAYKDANREHIRELNRKSYAVHKDEINARKREKRATETKKQKELRNKQRRLRVAEKREIKLRETKKIIKQKQILLVEKVSSLEALLRSMSYEFICKIWANCTETIKGETPDTEQSELYFKAFYNSVYTTVNSLVQELKQTLIDNVPEEDEK